MPSQTPLLYPGLTVYYCLSLPLELRGYPSERHTSLGYRVDVNMKTLNLSVFETLESRICGSVTIPHTRPSIFQSEHFRVLILHFLSKMCLQQSQQ